MNTITEYVPELYATFWALIPPLAAIILALITKEVYSSLFIGIIIGGYMVVYLLHISALKHLYFMYLTMAYLVFYQIHQI